LAFFPRPSAKPYSHSAILAMGSLCPLPVLLAFSQNGIFPQHQILVIYARGMRSLRINRFFPFQRPRIARLLSPPPAVFSQQHGSPSLKGNGSPLSFSLLETRPFEKDIDFLPSQCRPFLMIKNLSIIRSPLPALLKAGLNGCRVPLNSSVIS